MTTRNLDAVFAPRNVAVVGASERPGSLGRILLENLRHSFSGSVFAVNPRHTQILGERCYQRIGDLPLVADLAFVVTPPHTVPGLIAELVVAGVRGACVLTAGFGEGADPAGRALCNSMLQAAQPGMLRIVGPNCVGLQVPAVGLNGSFLGTFPNPGKLALVAQSGAMITAVLDWAEPRQIGFSHTVSLGDMADVDFGDMLDYLAADAETSAILLYMESVTHARKFMTAARAASRAKPVVVVKAGRSAAGARAAASHTGALAGADDVYEAAFRRGGISRVNSLEDMFDCAEALSRVALPSGDQLAVVTNGGGLGVMAADAAAANGLTLANLSAATIAGLDRVLPATWSKANPIDLIGDANEDRYVQALEVLLNAPELDGILIMNCPTAIVSSADVARAVVDGLPEGCDQTILTCWVGERSAREARTLFANCRLPTFESPEDSIAAYARLVEQRRMQGLLQQVTHAQAQPMDAEALQELVQRVIGDGREWLDEYEAKRLLALAGIPTVPTVRVDNAADAGEVASDLPSPVVVKIWSPDILHKSDVGGVRLDVAREQVCEVAEAMAERVRSCSPEAHIKGFTVQPMIRRPQAVELIVGMVDDTNFGPVLMVGHGGTAVEVINDKALGFPPLNRELARDMLEQTRVHDLLQGYRDVPAADLNAVDETLQRLSQLVAVCPQIIELDINPLLVDADGVLALDARVRVSAAAGAERFLIRPWPAELQHSTALVDGSSLLIRPVQPADDELLQAVVRSDRGSRLQLQSLPESTIDPAQFAARLSQIDYNRQMVLLGISDDGDLSGVVRVLEAPDGLAGEFAIALADDLPKGQGALVAGALLRAIRDYARDRGLQSIVGASPRGEVRVLNAAVEEGFEVTPDAVALADLHYSLQLGCESTEPLEDTGT